jgi:hypothetical protein
MGRVMLEESSPDQTQSFHLDGLGHSDFADGEFDASRASSRECGTCGGTLFLADVDGAMKVETWECAKTHCIYTEDLPAPSSR